ncbi:UDP-N-acetylmuramoyl-L-alanyl-D-glutamate--2,6-diaminopimelate ligase [Enterococcus sp. DIV0876]|uniref:UDP-N-acetylmuramoyl-L-alanyl-D-glutamate--2, 6-diaminopimelate ligase n=1 Tax=Enterococcus sp. DIV0876 TaxID=2774633 RepID=UPI003D300E17
MKLATLVKNCFLLTPLKDEAKEIDIQIVTKDSRLKAENSLFVAIKGTHCDGHTKIQEAIANGAVMVVVEARPQDIEIPYILVSDTTRALAQIAAAFYERPSHQLQVVGVTGTNGKTTVTQLIGQLTDLLDQKSAVVGTMHNRIADKIIDTVNTTPDSLTLHMLLAQMVESEISVAALEVSSHGLYGGRTWGIDFDVAVFTNLTQDHLDYHETMENYFQAKSLLFSQLGNQASAQNKLAVINWDDPYGRRLLQMTSANVLTYGCNGEGMLQAVDCVIMSSQTRFTLTYLGKSYQVSTKLIGTFNVANLLAAIGAMIGIGMTIDMLVPLIPALEPICGRFQTVENVKDVTAIVDYAHTPDGLEKVLQTIQMIAPQRIYCVVGCGGDRDKTKRPFMAAVAMRYADKAIFTMDNPRSEDPAQIVSDMVVQQKNTNYEIILDRQLAIHRALDLAIPGDIVLIAGKGHEMRQIIGTDVIHFDDREMIRAYRISP